MRVSKYALDISVSSRRNAANLSRVRKHRALNAPPGETTPTETAPAARPTRQAQALSAGAGIVLGGDDEALQLAIARDHADGEEVRMGGQVRYLHSKVNLGAQERHLYDFHGVVGGEVYRRRDISGTARRDVVWAVHEMRDNGFISRDLVETAERFSRLHLELEPKTKCAMFNDSVGGGMADPHRALLERTARAAHVDRLYDRVGKKLRPGELSAFAMAFSAVRPSLAEIRASLNVSADYVRKSLENGLLKLWALEPIMPEEQ